MEENKKKLYKVTIEDVDGVVKVYETDCVLAIINDPIGSGQHMVCEAKCSTVDLYYCYKGLKGIISVLKDNKPILELFEAADMLEDKEEEDDASNN